MTSLTYLKYCARGFGEDTPVQPGERVGVGKDLERNVKGYSRSSRRAQGKEAKWKKKLKQLITSLRWGLG